MIFRHSNGRIQRKCPGPNPGVKNKKMQMITMKKSTESPDLAFL
jgi:hypothetical protein